MSGVKASRFAPVFALALLAGCTAATPVDKTNIVAHYDAVAADFSAALGEGDWSLDKGQRHVREQTGGCYYDAGVWTPASKPTLPDRIETKEWQAIRDKLKPVLRKNGFGNGRLAQRADGPYVMARDTNGAAFTYNSDGTFSIGGARVDLSPCTDDALGLG